MKADKAQALLNQATHYRNQYENFLDFIDWLSDEVKLNTTELSHDFTGVCRERIKAIKPKLLPKEPIVLTVKYDLAFLFRSMAENEGAKIINVIEIKSCERLQYWLTCSPEKENIITDMAFMTWIKNPVFQKYYNSTKEFELIAEKYIQSIINPK